MLPLIPDLISDAQKQKNSKCTTKLLLYGHSFYNENVALKEGWPLLTGLI
jgi:hypothetical protein